MTSITQHPIWPEVRPLLFYKKWRAELRTPFDGRKVRKLLDVVIHCPTCGLPLHPIRRVGIARLTLNLTCEQRDALRRGRREEAAACSKSPEAFAEGKRIRQAMGLA